jgi:hypothetical protein
LIIPKKNKDKIISFIKQTKKKEKQTNVACVS